MLDGVPNFAFSTGYTNASWTLKCDLTAQFVSRLITYMRRKRMTVVRPEASTDVRSDAPMLDLQSGYVQRAADLLPRQGRTAPWRVRQNYAYDWLTLRTARLDDGTLMFRKRN